MKPAKGGGDVVSVANRRNDGSGKTILNSLKSFGGCSGEFRRVVKRVAVIKF